MTLPQVIERRASRRKSVHFSVRYFYLPPTTEPPDTQTINLSVDGACIETLDPLKEGASIAFYIITPNRGVIDVRARVVHVLPDGHPPYRVGVEFTHLSPADCAALERALNSIVE
jgi:c-di-GMP-binding flagellar brake protein YcgR